MLNLYIEHTLFRCGWTSEVWDRAILFDRVNPLCISALDWFSSFLGRFNKFFDAIECFAFAASVGWSIMFFFFDEWVASVIGDI